jgi:hypothetical protein
MRPARCGVPATSVTVDRRAPSICEKNSWVRLRFEETCLDWCVDLFARRKQPRPVFGGQAIEKEV